MERFNANEYPTKEEKRELAMLMNTAEKSIARWYTYMRRKSVVGGKLSQSE